MYRASAVGNKTLPERTSPASPQNPLQTGQPGDKAWADLGLQGKGNTALQKHEVWGNRVDTSFSDITVNNVLLFQCLCHVGAESGGITLKLDRKELGFCVLASLAAWRALGPVPVSGCHSGYDALISISISSQHCQREVHGCSSGAC